MPPPLRFLHRIVIMSCLLLAGAGCLRPQTEPRDAVRRETLGELRQWLPKLTPETLASGRISALDATWDDWQRRTGELPPDFDRMPSMAALPDPLTFYHSVPARPVRTREEWDEKRAWIKEQAQQWIYGRFPPAPDNLRVIVLSEATEGNARVRNVRLEFGPGHRATLRVDLHLPPGTGPFPVFLTNQNLARSWIAAAVRRGYIGAIFHAADPDTGDPDDSDGYIEAYPDHDFGSLARRAFAAMRTIDYLYRLPEVDKPHIGLAGHSRNGKMALVAAAFDERIAAVIPSSGLTNECMPWRYTAWDLFGTQSIQEQTDRVPHWAHPRIRFFAGREHKLPLDQDSIMALVAPRGLMLASGYAEGVGNSVGIEQAYRSARRVYEFLGGREHIALYLREGEHSVATEDLERFVDFFDAVFGRRKLPRPETWIHGYTFDDYRRLSGEAIEPTKFPARAPGGDLGKFASRSQWEGQKNELRNRLQWLLGDEPPSVPYPARRTIAHGRTSGTAGALAYLLGRPITLQPSPLSPDSVPVMFGDALEGTLHLPRRTKGTLPAGRWPVVVYLHPYTYARGHTHRFRMSFTPLLENGFAVFSFDQIGFGTRMHEALRFYERHPHWSLLGKMAADTQAAISALGALETVDATRIHLLGYALGGKVALFTAALDERPASVAVIAAFEPLRSFTQSRGTEGLPHYSHVHGLIPRLGFFIGHEPRVPVDYDEILGLIAPRPVVVVAATRDRYARVEDVANTATSAGHIYALYGRSAALVLQTPPGFSGFLPESQKHVTNWFLEPKVK